MEIIAEFLDDSKFKIFNNDKQKERVLVVGQVQSGKTNFMIEQSFEALSSGYDVSIIFGGTNNNLLSQTQKRFNDKIVDNEFYFFDSSDRNFKKIPQGKTVIVCLKGKASLEKLIELIKNTTEEKKMILFDDESDFGGIDISKSGNPSTINRLINEIYDMTQRITFVSVTATPFADILSQSGKSFNRAHALIPNEEYTGSKFFLNNKEIYDEIQDDEDLNDILEILISHVKRVESFGKNETQLLINNSLNTTDHISMMNKVQRMLDFIASNPEMNELDNIKHEEIVEELKDNIFVLNKDTEYINFKNRHSIIIGGALVSRGYTFEKLLTTVMINSPKEKNSADTLLQRARWFGYRRVDDIYKYMKVFISTKTRKSLIECDKLIEDVYKMIDDKSSMAKMREYITNQKFDYINPTGKDVK